MLPGRTGGAAGPAKVNHPAQSMRHIRCGTPDAQSYKPMHARCAAQAHNTQYETLKSLSVLT